jgi:hypothetical protein
MKNQYLRNVGKLGLAFFALLLSTQLSRAQLSGNKTVGIDYPSIAAFVTDVNAQGVLIGGGGVTLFVPAGYSETAPAGGYVLTATGTAAENITIVGAGSPQPIITANAGLTAGLLNDAIFKIIGGDYINIANLDMRENAANTTTATATNNMTEFGVALFYTSTTDGAQRNSIINNTITLNKTYTNTFAVYSNVRHNAISMTTAADITAVSGSNSNNKVYGNAISNVNYGIVFIGSATAAFQDLGNDIGGTGVSTGNVITNWGNAAAATGYLNLTGSNFAIFLNHEVNSNVSYNTINSAVHTSTNTLGGILQNFSSTSPTLASVSTINNNTITLSKSATSGGVTGILNQGISSVIAGSSVTMNNNAVINCSITGAASSTLLVGIQNSSAVQNISMNSNTIYGNTTTATTGGFTAIANTGSFSGALNIQNNTIGTSAFNAITYSVASSGAIGCVLNTGASTTGTLNITGNDIRGIVNSVTGSGTQGYITNSGVVANLNVTSNTFTNLNANTTGATTFISMTYSATATGTKTVSNNSIVTGFTRGGTSGSVLLLTDNGSSVTGSLTTIQNNNFSNINVTGTSTVTGFNLTDGGTAPTKTITNNTLSNWTGVTGTLTPVNITYLNGVSSLSNNTITSITNQGTITGINIGSSVNTATSFAISNNTIAGLTSTGAGGSVTGIAISNTSPSISIANNNINGLSSTGASLVSAISITGASSTSIVANRIYSLSSSNAGGTVFGINVTSGSGVNTYNNIISGLTAPNASGNDVIRGIAINSTSSATYGVYYNSIYLNASSGGANFGTTGIYHQANATAGTATLDLRNNIIVNESTPNGTGFTVAFRRSGVALNNYGSNSNRNLFYAGTPGATRLIMYDGTTSYQTMTTYQAAVVSRDMNSFTGEASFTASGYGTAGNFFMSLTGSSSDFLRPVAGITTQVESGGVSIATITTDYTGAARPSNPDLGAYEFVGISPAPQITLNSVTPPTTSQCTAAARLVSVNITTASGTIMGATIGYTVNGVPQTNIAMTNTSGSTWEGTIPVPTPVNAIITWGVAAQNSIGLNGSYTGTSYSDEPLFGAVSSVAASSSTICAGSTSTLTASLSRNGSATVGNGTGTTGATEELTAFCNRRITYRQQTVYTASDLAASGLTAGPITAIGYTIISVGNASSTSNFTVKIGTTGLSTLTDYVSSASFTTVRPAATYNHAIGLNTITFGTPFVWDGISNIIVEVSHGGVDLTNNAETVFTTTAGNTVAYGFNGAVTGTLSNKRFNTVFTGNTAPAIQSITWSDGVGTVGTTNPLTVNPTTTTTYTANLTAGGCVVTPAPTTTVTVNPLPSAVTATNSAQCGTQVPTASVTSTTGAPTPTFNWYSAAVGGTLLQNSTSTTYTTAISVTTTFYVSEVNGVTGCESPRTAVTVNVSTPDAISASASVPSVCENGSVTLTAANTNPTPFQSYTYSWGSTAGSGAATPVAGNPAIITPTAAGTYVYTVTATDGGCITTNTVSVTVNPNPSAIVVSATDTDICNGQAVNLSVTSTTGSPITPVTILAQNFDAGLGSWTTTFSGTAPASTGFMIQTAPYSIDGAMDFTNFATPQGGSFIMSNADLGTSGNKTRSTVVSPVFSTVGMTAANLTFENLYQKFAAGDSLVRLEISTNGGSSWTTLKDYLPLGNQGNVTNNAQLPANENISLASFLNQSNLRIRYNYVSAWGFYWLVDNINVIGTPADPTTYAWTSAPAGFTSSVQNPTGVAPAVTTNYSVNITNSFGCSATGSVNVIVNQPTTSSISATACSSYTWAQNGTTYTTSGAYTAVTPNAAGCDSTITLNLTINQPTSSSVTVSACSSYTWAQNGTTYTTSGSYPVVLAGANANGCDSTVTLNLTINQPTSSTVTVAACSSYTWAQNGTTYTTSGSYPVVLAGANANGCDSTVTLNLTINQPTSSAVTVVACSSYTWAENGTTYTTSGSYPVVLAGANANGCDSTVTLNLTINQPTSSTVTATACGSYTWAENGTTYTTSGSYPVVLAGANANGCDSTITLNLTINQPTSSTVTATACGSYTWTENGTTYTTSGSYPVVLAGANANGCDSTVTLNLTINQPTSSTVTATACGSYTWAENGTTYTTSGSYPVVLAGANANGCDSTITLNLTINNSTTGTDVQTACGTFTWIDGNTYTTSNNTATHTIVGGAANGCDSIVTLNLTINSLPTATATDNGDATITASAGNGYQWIDCTTNSPVNGATAQTFAPTANGTYAVVVSNASGCVDTSSCVVIDNVSIKETAAANIAVFPNPTHDNVTITMTATSATVEVVDAQGKLLQTIEVTNGGKVDLSTYQTGVYFLRIQTENGSTLERVVKN